jgi:hypothetical protein
MEAPRWPTALESHAIDEGQAGRWKTDRLLGDNDDVNAGTRTDITAESSSARWLTAELTGRDPVRRAWTLRETPSGSPRLVEITATEAGVRLVIRDRKLGTELAQVTVPADELMSVLTEQPKGAQTIAGEGRALEVELLDTGADTPTGGRVMRAAEHLAGEQRVCVTYADGLADIDLGESLAFHEAHGAPATMTVVRPLLQFGVARLDGEDRVTGFAEKPRSEHWINGGFFCFERVFLDSLEPDCVLERAPLERLARAGGLRIYRHEGFWRCMTRSRTRSR